MSELSSPSPAIVVGIDGSPGAVEAAPWAIDEALDRDLPLRLLNAIEPRDDASDSGSMAHVFATAEAAVRYASMAIEAADRPVRIEVEIVQGRCGDALVAASCSAAMVCVGARGIDADGDERVGMTPAELVARARCPVTIVHRGAQATSKPLSAAAEFADSPTEPSRGSA